ncbi:MAG: glycoside hydrolase family 97 N-terminal domain-containing protein, partial [Flavobacteriales bacterium]
NFKDRYRRFDLTLISNKTEKQLHVSFRLYDDGVAYRYRMECPGDSISVLSETALTRFQKAMRCWWSWADYNTLEKEVYSTSLKEATHAALPFTIRIDSTAYVSVLEAGIDDYTTMTFRQHEVDTASYRVHLVPWADGVAVRVKDTLKSPWRAFIVSSDAAGLLSSNLVMNLNEPATGD